MRLACHEREENTTDTRQRLASTRRRLHVRQITRRSSDLTAFDDTRSSVRMPSGQPRTLYGRLGITLFLGIYGIPTLLHPEDGRLDEARACARIMAASEPWRTFGRGFDASMAILTDATREVYVAVADERSATVGFLVLNMRGAFVGYIQTVAVREDWRGRGLGTALIGFAESRIFREAPNVFMCVSSFNHRAKALYQRLGDEVIGELHDYIVKGHSEWLLRKTIGPLMGVVTDKP